MNCTSFEGWLHAATGERQRSLPGDAAAHLAACAACRARWVAETRLDAAITVWVNAPLPSVSFDSVVDRLAIELRPARLQTQPISRRQSWVTVAAALAVLVVTGLTLRQSSQPQPSGIRTVQHIAPTEDATVSVSDSVAAIWTDVRSSSRAVARETVESLDQWSQMPAATLPMSPVENPAVTTPKWLPWSESIGENVNSAFGFLGEVVPMPSAG